MNRYFTTTLLATGLSVGLCTPLTAAAEDVNWIGTDGAWEDGATNWSSGTPPGALDFAHILYTGAVSSTAIGNIALEAVNFSTLSVSAGSLDIIGTLDTAGAVDLTGGATMSLGRLEVRSTGSFAATGETTTLDVVEGIFNYGQYTTEENAIATAESIDNFNELDVLSGSALTANSMINHAVTTFNVRDNDSIVTINGALTNQGGIGIAGNGRLVSNSIDNYDLFDVFDGGKVQVETFVNYADVIIGNFSAPDTAQLTVTELLTNLGTILLDNEFSSADLANTVNKGTITLRNGTITGGALDNRVDGSVVIRRSDVLLTETSKNRGQISIDENSTLTTDAYQQLEGETFVDGGTLAASLPFGIDITGGTLVGHGTLDGNLITREFGTLAPGYVPPSVDPGDPTGSFAISGDAILGGLFAVQIGGLNDFDWLDVAGDAQLGGTLAVELLDGFSPLLGNAFDILLADAVFGSFGSVLLPTLGAGLEFQLVNGLDVVRLAVIAAPVPVPAALWLFASAISACGLRARRRSGQLPV